MDDTGPDHGGATGEEARCDFLNGGEVDLVFAEEGVDEEIAHGDENDESERVKVGEDVVGDTVELHHGGLRGQVVV